MALSELALPVSEAVGGPEGPEGPRGLAVTNTQNLTQISETMAQVLELADQAFALAHTSEHGIRATNNNALFDALLRARGAAFAAYVDAVDRVNEARRCSSKVA